MSDEELFKGKPEGITYTGEESKQELLELLYGDWSLDVPSNNQAEVKRAIETILRNKDKSKKVIKAKALQRLKYDYIDDSLDSLTRVEFIGQGREFVRYAKDGKRFEVQIQDHGKTIKIFEVSCNV